MYANKKMGMRQKALEGMMGEEAPIANKKRPMEVEISVEEGGEEGMESILVTAEEKAMILEMRGQGEKMADDEELQPEGMGM